ncbi:sodium/glutamate symporter [Ignatzschineria sp. LJL83]
MIFEFDVLSTLLLTILCLLGGNELKKHINFLQRFCIPAPVIGGFLVSVLIWILKVSNLASFQFDTSIQTYLMIAFFTTIGLGGSFRILKSGGKLLLVYLCICWFIAFFQNTFGLGIAMALGIDPVLGVMSGAVSLTGGHGGAAAFGGMAEELGHSSATITALASATFGLIAGSLLGGPVASYLIKKHNVKIEADDAFHMPASTKGQPLPTTVDTFSFLKMLALVLLLMVIGRSLSSYFTEVTGFSLPGYVGAMLVAVIFRNVNDLFNVFEIQEKSVDLISGASLGLFLTMAMMSLKIWELSDVALPLFIILALQVIAILLITIFVVFRLLGKNYDAAVMCSGLLGHGLGATPNAMANMTSVCDRYKLVSTKALMIVPLSGAVLIDIVAIPYHTYLINFFS